MFGLGKKPPKRLGLEEQLRMLAAHGVALRSDRSVDDLLVPFGREKYESDPFSLLLFVLGGEVGEEPFDRSFSDDLYHFDTECIVDDGDYATKVERIGAISKGSLPVEQVRDSVDFEAGTAWIEISLDGRTHRFEPRFDDDWFDVGVLEWLGSLAVARHAPRRLMFLEPDGQDILVLFATPAQRDGLRKATGLEFHWVV